MKQLNNHALLIGIGQRLNEDEIIGVTAKDAERLAVELEKRCHFKGGNIKSLTSKDANRYNILCELDNLAKNTAGKNKADLVILFFSGHGMKKNGKHFLVTHDTDADNIPKNAIDGQTFIEKVNAINAKSILILLNCCYSGGILSKGYVQSDVPFNQSEFVKTPNRAIITACSRDEEAFTSTPLSIFMYGLLEGLAGVDIQAKEKKAVTLFDLAMYVRERVTSLCKQRPELQILNHALTANFVIVDYSNGMPEFQRILRNGGLYDRTGRPLNLEPSNKTDAMYRQRFDWLRKRKNVIEDSVINVGGDFSLGDKGQSFSDIYDSKNILKGSTVTAGKNFKLGDDFTTQVSNNTQQNKNQESMTNTTAVDYIINNSHSAWVKKWFIEGDAITAHILCGDFDATVKRSVVETKLTVLSANNQFQQELTEKLQQTSDVAVGTEKNIISGSKITAKGNAHIGDKGNPSRDNYTKKNVIKDSTIKAGGNFRLGDDVVSGNQNVQIVHHHYNNQKTTENSPPQYSSLKSELKMLLATEKTVDVIKRLLNITENADSGAYNSVLMQSARFYRVSDKEDRRIISEGEANVERNQINDSLTKIIDKLEI